MIILFLALIFGIAAFVFLLTSIMRGKKNGTSGKVLNVLKVVLLVEAAALIVVFAIVIIKTLI